MAELLHIEKLMERKPAQLSGGEMQRVALGRALVRDPRAFLMDEPLTNLDLKLRVEMRTELTRIHRSLGRTFLYVTNDQVEAMSMADRVAVLREGTVQQVGSPTEIYDRPANRWVATFVGSPRMNLLPCTANGRLEGTGWSLPNPGFAFQGDRPALLGVRSEDLSLEARDESAALDGRVYAVEPLGDRTLVDVEIGDQRIVIKAPPTASLQIGEQVRAAVDLDRIHLFDAGTESADRAADDRRPAPAGAQAGADPRARSARRRRVARGPRVRARRLAGHRAPRPRAAVGRRACSSACAAAPARCPTPGRRSRPAWNTRVRGAAREKDAIALKARALVEDGSTIFIDASTTGMALARALELRPPTALTLVTNSPAIALGLTADSIYVIMTPGELDQHMRVLTGRWTADFLADLNLAVAFISAAGITLEHGLTTSRAALADTLNAAAECAREDGRAGGLDEVQARLAPDRPQRAVAGHDHHRRRARPGHRR